jgi:hypothetical protein
LKRLARLGLVVAGASVIVAVAAGGAAASGKHVSLGNLAGGLGERGGVSPANALAATGPPPRYAVVDASFSITPDGQTHGAVSCPIGTVPLGGGVDIGGRALVNSTYPTSTGWAGDVNNPYNTTVDSFRVDAICAKRNKYWSIQQSAARLNRAGFQTEASVQCPSGTKVLGGGGHSSANSTAVNLNSTFPVKTDEGPSAIYSWTTRMNNADSTDHSVSSYAVCGRERGGYRMYAEDVSTPGTNVSTVNLPCPSDLPAVVIGGGARSSSGSTLVNLDATIVGSNGWYVGVDNETTQNYTVTVYVICAGT